MNDTKHTPTPLQLLENIADESIVAAGDPDYIQVRRMVSVHEELVAALTELVNAVDAWGRQQASADNSPEDDALIDANLTASAVLAKVSA